jgi:DNA-binding NtrC family response regulator
MYTRPNILLLSNDESERTTMEQVIGGYATLTFADCIAAIEDLLQDGSYDAFLCSWVFQEGVWRDALRNLQRNYPDLPVIVLSRTGGEKEWLEVLEAGAFDLLAAPYHPGLVMGLLEQAVSTHEAVTAGKHQPMQMAAKVG